MNPTLVCPRHPHSLLPDCWTGLGDFLWPSSVFRRSNRRRGNQFAAVVILRVIRFSVKHWWFWFGSNWFNLKHVTWAVGDYKGSGNYLLLSINLTILFFQWIARSSLGLLNIRVEWKMPIANSWGPRSCHQMPRFLCESQNKDIHFVILRHIKVNFPVSVAETSEFWAVFVWEKTWFHYQNKRR